MELWQIIFIISLIPLWIISGLCRSLVHTLLHHYSAFKEKFKIKNDRFWNPEISWKGKYITDDNFDLILDINHKPIEKRGVIIPLFDAFHRFNTIELIADHLREGIYFGLLASFMYHLFAGPSFLVFLTGFLSSGGMKILISFNLGYDKLWR